MRKTYCVLVATTLLLGACTAEQKPQTEPIVEAIEPVITTQQITVTPQQVYTGDTVLINHTHAIQQEPTNIQQWQQEQLALGSADLSLHIHAPLTAMLTAAQQDGVDQFVMNNGYRSVADQQLLYEQKGSELALPAGYSEHHLGLAVDINSRNGLMEHTAEGAWLAENSWAYGFILRYPADKTEITGIAYEAWHFRYVGLPHSYIMQKENWALEEYITYLQQHKQYRTTYNDIAYEVQYVPVSAPTTVEILKDVLYNVSGDNAGGVLITTQQQSARQ